MYGAPVLLQSTAFKFKLNFNGVTGLFFMLADILLVFGWVLGLFGRANRCAVVHMRGACIGSIATSCSDVSLYVSKDACLTIVCRPCLRISENVKQRWEYQIKVEDCVCLCVRIVVRREAAFVGECIVEGAFLIRRFGTLI